MLRKFFFFVLLLSPLVMRGQLLSVTATLTDSDGTVWANATCSVQVYSPNGVPFFGTTPVPTAPQTCAVDVNGNLTTSIYNTSTITPTGAQYQFNINSATSDTGSSFLTPVTAANMTATLSALIKAPRFNATLPFAYGYVDAEAVATRPGATYYRTTGGVGTRTYNGSAWAGPATSNLTVSPVSGTTNGTITFGGNFGAPAIMYYDGGANNQYYSEVISGSLEFIAPNANSNFAYILGGNLFNINITNGPYWGPNGATKPLMVLNTTTPTASIVACVKAAGPPLVIGTCSSVVAAGGTCTCN